MTAGMFCSSSGLEGSGAGADTGPAATLGEASAAQADSGPAASLEHGQGTSVSTKAHSVAPQPDCASLVLPAQTSSLPGLLPRSSISAGRSEATGFQPVPSFGAQLPTTEAAADGPGHGFHFLGPLSSLPPRSRSSASATLAGNLQPAVEAQLAMCEPSLTDRIAGSSTYADW